MSRTRLGDDDVLHAARAELSRELDALYVLMQDPEIDAATERGFHASADEMGVAAVEYARRSGSTGRSTPPRSVHCAQREARKFL